MPSSPPPSSGEASGLATPRASPQKTQDPVTIDSSPLVRSRVRQPSKRRQEAIEEVQPVAKRRRVTKKVAKKGTSKVKQSKSKVNKRVPKKTVIKSARIRESINTPPSAQQPVEEVVEVNEPPMRPRHQRNILSLLSEFGYPTLLWKLSWSLRIKNKAVYSDTVTAVDATASTYWRTNLKGALNSVVSDRGIPQFRMDSVKVVAKLARRSVAPLSYIRSSGTDWSPLDDQLHSWSLKYPGEAIVAVVAIDIEVTGPPTASQRTVRRSVTSQMEANLERTDNASSPGAIARFIRELHDRWKCKGSCSYSSSSNGFCWVNTSNQRHAKIPTPYWLRLAAAMEAGVVTAEEPPPDMKRELERRTIEERGGRRRNNSPTTPAPQRLIIETSSSIAAQASVVGLPAIEPPSSPWRMPVLMDQRLSDYIEWWKTRYSQPFWKVAFAEALKVLNSHFVDFTQVRSEPKAYLVDCGIEKGIAKVLKRDTRLWKVEVNRKVVVEEAHGEYNIDDSGSLVSFSSQ
jgi:hypothetical protein